MKDGFFRRSLDRKESIPQRTDCWMFYSSSETDFCARENTKEREKMLRRAISFVCQ